MWLNALLSFLHSAKYCKEKKVGRRKKNTMKDLSNQAVKLVEALGHALKNEKDTNDNALAILQKREGFSEYDDDGNPVLSLEESIAINRHCLAFVTLIKAQEEVRKLSLEMIGADTSNADMRIKVYQEMVERDQKVLEGLGVK